MSYSQFGLFPNPLYNANQPSFPTLNQNYPQQQQSSYAQNNFYNGAPINTTFISPTIRGGYVTTNIATGQTSRKILPF